MIGALVVLAVLALLVAGAARSATFAPGGPTVDPDAGPRVDAASSLRNLAPTVPFALRVPEVPESWRSNAVDQSDLGDGRVVRTGYITGEGRFVRLVQSDAAQGALLTAEGSRSGRVPPAAGTVEAGGMTWTVLAAADAEPVWVTDTGSVRWLITGSVDEAGFRALAEATAAGTELPVGEAPPR